MSKIREEAMAAIETWVEKIDMDKVNDVLEVGIGGDPKPGGNFYLFRTKNYKTMDDVAAFQPDYICSVECPPDELVEQFDVVIISQTLEHVKSPSLAIVGAYTMLRPGGYLIVDCPWNGVAYHAEDEFKDYWRISKDGMEELLTAFDNVEIEMSEILTTALARK